MSVWYFAYGLRTSPERFSAEFSPRETQPASLAGHRLFFSSPQEEEGGGTSCIVPDPGGTVLGAAYRVDEETLRRIGETKRGKRLVTKTAQIMGKEQEVHLFLPATIGAFAVPGDAYLARVREGLTYFYPVTMVDAYLRKALERENLFDSLLIQRADEAVYNREYGCDFRRLYPWKGMVRTTAWGSAIGVLKPGEATTPHHHDEEETSMILAGKGEITLDGKKSKIKCGDVIFHPPDSEHTILNTSENENLEVLFIWWGGSEVEHREAQRLAPVVAAA